MNRIEKIVEKNISNNKLKMDVVDINKHIKALNRNIKTIPEKTKEKRAKKFNENVLGNEKINNPTITKL